MERELEGRVALVTGGGSGIGRAASCAFGAAGAAVGVLGRDVTRIEETAKLVRESGGRAIAVRCDVSRAPEVESAVEVVISTFGRLDILVNNAAVSPHLALQDLSEEEWDYVIDTNLKGPYLLTRAAVPFLKASDSPAIVNVTSVQAFASQENQGPYSASKAGLVALTRCMALEYARDGIRVNCVAPGSVRTPMLLEGARAANEAMPDQVIDAWAASHPLGFIIEPADVAELILFLAAPRARAITGAPFLIDGGLLAKLAI